MTEKKKIKLGIIAAMSVEAEKIVSSMEDVSEEKCGNIVFTSGRIGKTNVVCAVCGIGKVFAAMCAEAMIIKYSPEYIINTGVAGTLTEDLSIGDVALSRAVVQHDMDTSAIGDPVGLIPGFNLIEIPASEDLSSLVSSIMDKMKIKHERGVIASGDVFVAEEKIKKQIRDRFSAIACEMEGGSVGQVCFANGIPFLIIRAISDDANSGACKDYPAFAEKAASVSAELTVRLAMSLPFSVHHKFSWKEIIDRMYDKDLSSDTEDAVKVIYSSGRDKRFIIFRDRSTGVFEYRFEKLEEWDDIVWDFKQCAPDETPASWLPFSSPHSSRFGSEEDAWNEVITLPDYKRYFE